MMQINNGLGIFYVIYSYIVLSCKICIIYRKWLYINNIPPPIFLYIYKICIDKN